MQPNQLWPWFFRPVCGAVAAATEQSVHWRCLSAVCQRVRDLELDGLSTASVLLMKIPAAVSLGAANIPLPSVLITPYGPEHMNPLQGTNQQDDVEYPVLVSIVDRDNQDPTSACLDRYLNWREAIARSFRNQRLGEVPEIIGCWVEPSAIVHPDSWMKGFFHSSLLFWFVSREPRGA